MLAHRLVRRRLQHRCLHGVQRVLVNTTRFASIRTSKSHRPDSTLENMKLLGLISISLAASEVSAHGYLSQPPAAFKNGYLNTSCTATINASVDAAFAGKTWDDDPVVNTFNFINSFTVSKFKTLRDLIDPVEPDCGNTVLTGEPIDVSSFHSMKWQNDQLREGFIASHHVSAWLVAQMSTTFA